MPLLLRRFRDSKDRIRYAAVFLMGCALLILGLSGGGIEWLYFGAGAIILSWIMWEKEWDYLHWLGRRSGHKMDGAAKPHNEIPSDSSPACESTDYDSGPHFTYDLGRGLLSFPCPTPSDKAPSAKSSWLKTIILSAFAEPELSFRLCLIILFVPVLCLMGLIYITATYPIAIFAIACVLPLALYISDRLCRKKRHSVQKGG